MNPRTLIITAGLVVALVAPAAAGAKVLPTTDTTKHAKHAKHTGVATHFKRHGQPLARYIDISASGSATVLSPSELCNQQNEDLVAHALDPIDCPNTDAQPATSDQPTATSDSSAAGADEAETGDSTTASNADTTVSQTSSATDDSTLSDPDSDC
jgi:hypothetical protein